jgi:hypothetical protein
MYKCTSDGRTARFVEGEGFGILVAARRGCAIKADADVST